MSSCNHENVVSYHTSFVYKEELWLILRLLDAGSLLDIVRHKMKTQECRNGVLDEVNNNMDVEKIARFQNIRRASVNQYFNFGQII